MSDAGEANIRRPMRSIELTSYDIRLSLSCYLLNKSKNSFAFIIGILCIEFKTNKSLSPEIK
jgi:hypothetical protein